MYQHGHQLTSTLQLGDGITHRFIMTCAGCYAQNWLDVLLQVGKLYFHLGTRMMIGRRRAIDDGNIRIGHGRQQKIQLSMMHTKRQPIYFQKSFKDLSR
jgi:hypothetical protein